MKTHLGPLHLQTTAKVWNKIIAYFLAFLVTGTHELHMNYKYEYGLNEKLDVEYSTLEVFKLHRKMFGSQKLYPS